MTSVTTVTTVATVPAAVTIGVDAAVREQSDEIDPIDNKRAVEAKFRMGDEP